jgi:hypothetical protein
MICGPAARVPKILITPGILCSAGRPAGQEIVGDSAYDDERMIEMLKRHET